MMRIIAFDTETSGLKPGRICQLAYIVADGGQDEPPRGESTFFKVDYVEPGALNVHGYSPSALAELSGGLGFGDHAERVYNDFNDARLWVAHNLDFDRSFLNAEFKRAGRTPPVRRGYCTMRGFTPVLKLPSAKPTPVRAGGGQYKYPNLAELINWLGLTHERIAAFADEVFRVTARDGLRRHDARFDSAAAYLAYSEGLARGLINP